MSRDGMSLANRGWKSNAIIGTWCTFESAAVIGELLSRDFDFIGIDCQHSTIDDASAARLVRDIDRHDTAIVVRISNHNRAAVGRVLDAGADAVVVPTVETASQAEEVIRAAHYPPEGTRSFGPFRPGTSRVLRELSASANCFPMIETVRGLENVNDICSVPNIAGIDVGLADLAISMGNDPSDTEGNQDLVSALDPLLKACESSDIIAGVHIRDAKTIRRWLELGFRFISVGNDKAFLNAAAAAELALARHESSIGGD